MKYLVLLLLSGCAVFQDPCQKMVTDEGKKQCKQERYEKYRKMHDRFDTIR